VIPHTNGLTYQPARGWCVEVAWAARGCPRLVNGEKAAAVTCNGARGRCSQAAGGKQWGQRVGGVEGRWWVVGGDGMDEWRVTFGHGDKGGGLVTG
jgi:hypothetical protein